MTANQSHLVPATKPMKGCFQSFDRIAQVGCFSVVSQAARQNSASTSSLVSDSQRLYFNHSAADTNCAGAARRFEVEDLARLVPRFGRLYNSLVRWPPSYSSLMAILFTFSSAGYQSPTKAASEERDTYEVYSAVLRDHKPSVETWKIVNETKPFTFCLKPSQDLVIHVSSGS